MRGLNNAPVDFYAFAKKFLRTAGGRVTARASDRLAKPLKDLIFSFSSLNKRIPLPFSALVRMVSGRESRVPAPANALNFSSKFFPCWSASINDSSMARLCACKVASCVFIVSTSMASGKSSHASSSCSIRSQQRSSSLLKCLLFVFSLGWFFTVCKQRSGQGCFVVLLKGCWHPSKPNPKIRPLPRRLPLWVFVSRWADQPGVKVLQLGFVYSKTETTFLPKLPANFVSRQF